jgi:cation:H+ antiporter
MIWIQFLAAALVIVLAGMRLARYGDVLGEKTGLGRSWIGVVLLAATTSLPELFTGIGATALAALPDIAVGDVLGSCMFNLLILSFMDAIQPEPLSTRTSTPWSCSRSTISCSPTTIGEGSLVRVSTRLPSTRSPFGS